MFFFWFVLFCTGLHGFQVTYISVIMRQFWKFYLTDDTGLKVTGERLQPALDEE